MFRTVLVLGRGRPVVTVVRSLAWAGYRVVLGRELRKRLADYSRYVHEVWEHPSTKDQEQFLLALGEFLSARPDVSVVFPTGDDVLACLARHPDRIPASAAPVVPDSETLLLCLDKPAVYDVLREIDIPFPRTKLVHSLGQLHREAERIGFPVSVKPPSSFRPFHPKAFICRDRDELYQRLPVWPQQQPALVLQEYAPGLRRSCDLMAVEGEMNAYFEFKALRTDWHDGTGMTTSAVTIPPTPELHEYCRRLLKRLNYSGPAAVQWLMDDRTGAISFLEINPRLDASCAFALSCGYSLPALAAEWAEHRKQGLKPPPATLPPYPVGVRGVWLTGDLDGLLLALSKRAIGPKMAFAWLARAVGSALRARMHLVFHWKDPLPAVYCGVDILRTLAGMICRDLPRSLWRRLAAKLPGAAVRPRAPRMAVDRAP